MEAIHHRLQTELPAQAYRAVLLVLVAYARSLISQAEALCHVITILHDRRDLALALLQALRRIERPPLQTLTLNRIN